MRCLTIVSLSCKALMTVLFSFFPSPATALDMDMAAAVELALLRNPELQGGYQALRQVRQEVGIRFVDHLPSITAGVSGNARTIMFSPDSRSMTAFLEVEQPVLNGGAGRRARDSLEQRHAIEVIRQRERRTEIIISTVSLYARILGLTEQLRLQKQHLRELRRQLPAAEKEYELGEMTELELLEFRLALENRRLSLHDTEREHERAVLELRSSLDLREEPVLTEVLNTDYAGFLSPSPAEAYTVYMEAASSRLEEIRSNMREIRRELEHPLRYRVPVVSASARLELMGRDIQNMQPALSASLRIDLGTLLPLDISLGVADTPPLQRELSGSGSTGLSVDKNIFFRKQELTRQLDDLTTEYRLALSRQAMEITFLLADLEHLKDTLRMNRAKTDVLERRVALAEKQFDRGEITRRKLADLREELANHRLEILQEIVELFLTELKVAGKAGLMPGGFALEEITS